MRNCWVTGQGILQGLLHYFSDYNSKVKGAVNLHTTKSYYFQYSGNCTFSLNYNHVINRQLIFYNNHILCSIGMFEKLEKKGYKIWKKIEKKNYKNKLFKSKKSEVAKKL